MSPEPICPNRCDWRCSDDGEGCIRRARNNSVGRCHVEIFVRPMRYKGSHQAHNAKVAICALFTTHSSLKLQGRRKVFSPIRKVRAISQKLYSQLRHDSRESPSRLTRPLTTPPAVSLYGLCQGGVSIGDRSAHLFSFVSFFVRSESPFLRPDLHLACRWRAQKLSRLAVAPTLSDKLRRCQATP